MDTVDRLTAGEMAETCEFSDDAAEEIRAAIRQPRPLLNRLQWHCLQPRRLIFRALYGLLYYLNRILLRLFFRVHIHGADNLPRSDRFVLAANHSSPLDAPLLAGALPLTVLENTYWAGKESTVLKNALRRGLSFVTRVMPISSGVPALAAGAAVLQSANLVWFPEGRRSRSGELLPFRPGIAWLLQEHQVTLVPVRIDGAQVAYRDRSAWPRLGTRIDVRIGKPLSRTDLGIGAADSTVETVLAHIRAAVLSA